MPDIETVTLKSSDTEARFLTYGLALTRFRVGGKDYVVGLPDTDSYLGQHPYVGTVIGPVANRIADGRFEIDGHCIRVATNENGNALHSGPDGFDRQIWTIVERASDRVSFRHVMPDGDQGYPGPLTVTVTAKVGSGMLEFSYEATTERATPVSLTHHAYFLLPDCALADDMTLRVDSSTVTRVDSQGLPTSMSDVLRSGDTLDFRTARRVGDIEVDNSYNLDGKRARNGLVMAATLESGRSGLSVLTDLPALQVYTGETLQRAGRPPRSGLALEPQYPPNLVNTARAEDVILRPGETYRHRIRYEVRRKGDA